jgi:hypothetical protein
MSTQRDHVDPRLEEIPTTSTSEEMDPKVLDLAMKIVEKMFLKMKEVDAKRKVEEEESRRKAEEDKGKRKIEYNDDLVELLVSKVMSKVSLNTEKSSTESKGNELNRVQFDYSRNFIPNFSSVPLGKLPTLSELNYDEWADKMKSHIVGVPRPGGPLGRRVSVAVCPSPDGSSARESAKGGEARRPETGVREVGILRPSCSSHAQVGCACSRGLQASTREREASGPKRAPVSSSSPRGQPSLRGPWSFLL